MGNLTRSQVWLLGCFVSSALVLANTFFVEGEVQTYLYVVLSLIFAGFTVIMYGGNKAKREG